MPNPIVPNTTTASAPQAPTANVTAKVPHPPTVDNPAVVEAFRQGGSVGSLPRTNYLLDETIIAKPLNSASDLFFRLKPKNPGVVFRGIATNVSTKDGPSNKRYDEASFHGYRNVTVADVNGPVPDSMVKEGGARIAVGDLTLMMIDRREYLAALKWKEEQAMRATRRTGAIESGNRELIKALQESSVPSRLGRKLQPFSPSDSEVIRDFGQFE